ncbi:dynamin family protein [Vibrio parahaemolyticus]|nr:hypothetical protein [Vibrio parahaemolyticus]
MNQEIVNDLRLDLIDHSNVALKNIKKLKLSEKESARVTTLFTNEITKLSQNLLTIGVVGVMKAGKSTFINSLIGREILPSRTLGMTFIPTKIQHKYSDNDNIEYYFSLSENFQQFANWLGQKSVLDRVKTSEIAHKVDPMLLEELSLGNVKVEKTVSTLIEAHKQLFIVNDLARINSWYLSNHQDCSFDLLKHIGNESDIPTIFVRFHALKDESFVDSSIALIDSPGPDEAGQNMALASLLKQVLINASAVYCVINGKKIDDLSDEDLRRQINTYKNIISDRLQLVVNQKDQIDKNLLVEDVILSSKTFGDFELQGKIHTISSKSALYCNLAISNAKDVADCFTQYQSCSPKWFEEFASLRGGVESYLDDLEEDLEDGKDLSIVIAKHAHRMFSRSGLDEFIENSLVDIYRNSSVHIIRSALDTFLSRLDADKNTSTILHSIRGQINSLELDNNKLSSFQGEMEYTIKKILKIKEKTRKLIDVELKDSDYLAKEIAGIIVSEEPKNHFEKAREEYKNIESIIKESNEEYSSDQNAKNELSSIKNRLLESVELLNEELNIISEQKVKERISHVNNSITPQIEEVLAVIKDISEEVIDWSFDMPSIKQYSSNISFDSLSTKPKKVPKYYDRDILGIGFLSKFATKIMGKRKEDKVVHVIDVESMRTQISEHLDKLLKYGFEQGELIAICYQEELMDFSDVISNVISKTLDLKLKSKVEILEELSKLHELNLFFTKYVKSISDTKMRLNNV